MNGNGVLTLAPEVKSVAKKRNYLALFADEDRIVNLSGNYNYLETHYYRSQDMENEGRIIHPTNKESLDAYIAPLFLEKARLAGIPVPVHYITNGFFEPPVIVDTVNPFMHRTSFVLKASRQPGVAKSLTRNFTYCVCCQEIPAGARVRYFRSVLGWSISRRYRDLSEKVWKAFRIPLAKVRVLLLENGEALLSSIELLPFEKLNSRELQHIEEKVRWLE